MITPNFRLSLSTVTTKADALGTLHHWEKAESWKRGMVGWGVMWSLAIISLPIPLVHFVVFPFAFLLGPFIGYLVFKIYYKTLDLDSVDGSCPDCQAQIVFESKTAQWPLVIDCLGCSARIEVSPG